MGSRGRSMDQLLDEPPTAALRQGPGRYDPATVVVASMPTVINTVRRSPFANRWEPCGNHWRMLG